MPNWCYNKLTIAGPGLDRFVDYLRDRCPTNDIDSFSLDWFVKEPSEETATEPNTPTPPEQITAQINTATTVEELRSGLLLLRPPPAAKHDWYSWRCKHWGTKWDVSELSIHPVVRASTERYMEITFETAWNPPLPVTRAMGELFPDVEITHTYGEPGMAFGGTYEVYGGAVVFDDGCTFAETEWYSPDDEEEAEEA
jgi:hypothetical protein